MRQLFYSVIFIFIILTTVSCKQTDTLVDRVYFQFHHSLRIPYYKVDIEVLNDKNTITMKVQSVPLIDSIEWNYSKVDTSFAITETQFIEIVESIDKVFNSHHETENDFIGLDGSTWTYEIERGEKIEKIVVWSPAYDKETRNVNIFLKAAEIIVDIAGLPVSEVLIE